MTARVPRTALADRSMPISSPEKQHCRSSSNGDEDDDATKILDDILRCTEQQVRSAQVRKIQWSALLDFYEHDHEMIRFALDSCKSDLIDLTDDSVLQCSGPEHLGDLLFSIERVQEIGQLLFAERLLCACRSYTEAVRLVKRNYWNYSAARVQRIFCSFNLLLQHAAADTIREMWKFSEVSLPLLRMKGRIVLDCGGTGCQTPIAPRRLDFAALGMTRVCSDGVDVAMRSEATTSRRNAPNSHCSISSSTATCPLEVRV